MDRCLLVIYGLLAYGAGLLVSLYSVAFFGNLGLAHSLDSPPRCGPVFAISINTAWLVLFAAQHSFMARATFKNWLARYVTRPAERSTYVLVSSLLMLALFLGWQPIGFVIWDVTETWLALLIYGIYFLGWLVMVWSIWLMNHSEMLGMRQVWFYFLKRPYTPIPLTEPGPYKVVRHPMYLGWLIVFWATPIMSTGHLILSVGLSVYILVAIRWEERDLAAAYGVPYQVYRKKVPMLIPLAEAWGKQRNQKVDP